MPVPNTNGYAGLTFVGDRLVTIVVFSDGPMLPLMQAKYGAPDVLLGWDAASKSLLPVQSLVPGELGAARWHLVGGTVQVLTAGGTGPDAVSYWSDLGNTITEQNY